MNTNVVHQKIGEIERLLAEVKAELTEVSTSFLISAWVKDNFVKIEGGTFNMGDEKGNLPSACRPVHRVTVADFYLSKTPVTQKQWRDVMGSNPAHFKDCDECPVENVSWNDAQAFIDKLNKKTGMKFRLPTEAEWEYAARGGNKSNDYRYSGSDSIDAVAWFEENSDFKIHAVGKKQPNELGLYDMSGNVWEWCQDWYVEKYYELCKKQGIVENPKGPETSSYRVLRGGSWDDDAQGCRSAYRIISHPDGRLSYIGFRLVFVP